MVGLEEAGGGILPFSVRSRHLSVWGLGTSD